MTGVSLTRLRQLICGCVIAACVAAIGAGVASAATFYVNQRSGLDTEPCTSKGGLKPPEFPCKTINGAIKKAEAVPGPNTIEVASESGEEGTYKEAVELSSEKDKGLTINGEEPGVVVVTAAKHAVFVGPAPGAVTLSNLSIKATGFAAVRDLGSELTLVNDKVEAESAKNGVEASPFAGHGSLAIVNGELSMESGTTGYAVEAVGVPLTLDGVHILTGAGAGAEAGGVYSEKSSLSVTNTDVSVVSESLIPPVPMFGISAGKDSSVSMQNVRVRQSSAAVGVELEASPTNASDLNVEMVDASSTAQAVGSQSETPVAASSFSHLEVSGTWAGIGMQANAGDLTLSDSRIVVNPESKSPALHYSELSPGRGLVVQRSVLQAGPSAEPGAVRAEEGNLTVDSSEILGGKDGVYFESSTATTLAVTLSASTIDAGASGVATDAAGTNGIEAVAKKGPGSAAKVAIQGSIVLEQQAASAAIGDHSSIACAYSAVPGQSQAESGGSGAIACATGSSGNTEVNPLSSLFAEPLSAYQLSPSSGAVDSVPAGAIALPFEITPSATDLAGNPRVVDGNGDCLAVQDKGALELQGHSAPCPPHPPHPSPPAVVVTKPVAGVISALTISPTAFSAAPKGATVSKASKKKYGAKIGYRDSQAATTTFTVLLPTPGRMQGRTCKKPGKANRHGRRCTLYKALGSFTHLDKAGANSLHFSGRLKGRKLAPGAYRLQAIAHNAAGNGAATSKSFTIK